MAKNRIGALRLVSQRIVGSDFDDPTKAVRWMLALQGQDLPGAKWSIGIRTKSATNVDVEKALAAGTIVRSWPMRGTLHFMPAEDLGWLLALTTARIIKGAAKRREQLGLDDKLLERMREVAQRLLEGKKALTRDEMHDGWKAATIEMNNARVYHALWFLSQTGTLCFGPMRGKDQSVVLLDEWVKKPRRLSGDEALGELARRYFESHGPATVKDLAWWTKLTAGETKRAVEIAKKELATLHHDGTTYYLAKDTEDRLASLAPELTAALSGFDEFILGYQDRSAVLPTDVADRIVPGGNGMFLASMIDEGHVIGLWKRSAKKKETAITMEPFARASAATRSRFTRAVKRWGAFWGVTVALTD